MNNTIDNIPEGKRYRGGRKPVEFVFTYEDIAEFVGKSGRTVRNQRSVENMDFRKLKVLFGYMRRFK